MSRDLSTYTPEKLKRLAHNPVAMVLSACKAFRDIGREDAREDARELKKNDAAEPFGCGRVEDLLQGSSKRKSAG